MIHSVEVFFSPQCLQSSMSQPPSSKSSIDQWTAQSGSVCGAVGAAEGPSLLPEAAEQDDKLKQYLEDERIALFLQNEEFMRELQRNHDFLMALERGRTLFMCMLKFSFKCDGKRSMLMLSLPFCSQLVSVELLLVI